MTVEPRWRTLEGRFAPSRPVTVAEKRAEQFPAAVSSLPRSLAMLAEVKTR